MQRRTMRRGSLGLNKKIPGRSIVDGTFRLEDIKEPSPLEKREALRKQIKTLNKKVAQLNAKLKITTMSKAEISGMEGEMRMLLLMRDDQLSQLTKSQVRLDT